MWRSPKRRPNSSGGRQGSLRTSTAAQDAELSDIITPNLAFGNEPLETMVPIPQDVQEKEDYKEHVNSILTQQAQNKGRKEPEQVYLELLRATNIQTVDSLKEDDWLYTSDPATK